MKVYDFNKIKKLENKNCEADIPEKDYTSFNTYLRRANEEAKVKLDTQIVFRQSINSVKMAKDEKNRKPINKHSKNSKNNKLINKPKAMSQNAKSLKNKLEWPIKIFILTLSLSLMFSVVSEMALSNSGIIISLSVIFILMFVASAFDALGVAVSACGTEVFVNWQGEKIKGIKQAEFLTRHADKVASFCCDIVGDTCGILSGSAGAAIVFKLVSDNTSQLGFFVSILITSIIAGLTVFCKALGKNYAINKSASIIFAAGRVMSVFSLNNKNRKNKNKHNRNKKKEYDPQSLDILDKNKNA